MSIIGIRHATDVILALRLMLRDWRAGELTLLAVAVFIAVASVTTVGFFTDRVHQALIRQSNQLLGADLVISGDRPLGEIYAAEAAARGLQVTRMLRFPSMAARETQSVLAEIKAVNGGYPLRGTLRIADTPQSAARRATEIPASGTVWVDERLLARLAMRPGESITIGRSTLTVAAVIIEEPDSTIGFINSGPRVLMNADDLAATGLVQPGSRIRYRVQVAGSADAVARYRTWLEQRLLPGQRVESIRDARPEIRSALERAEQFLNLAALLSVVLAAVAVALAARRFLERHLDACAMMRCYGANQARVVRLYVLQFIATGAVASLAGSVAGWIAQQVLATWLGNLVTVALPGAGLTPAVHGFIAGLALLLGFALPPLLALGRVPPLRVLRRDIGAPGGLGLVAYALAATVVAGLIVWRAGDWRAGLIVVAGFCGAMMVAALAVWGLLRAMTRMPWAGVSWRFGIASLRRRRLASVLQAVALGVGIMALLTLSIIRTELLDLWQTSLPPDAPNRFIVNIQPDQVPALREFLDVRKRPVPTLYPMVRGRLTRINSRAVSPADYTDDRARRLVDREFNLSWATQLQTDNVVTAGTWWGQRVQRADQFSMEQGIASTLGVNVGDTLTFDIAGRDVSATVTSLRKVDWDSFNVNFFVVAPPGLLEEQPASYVTSFYLPPGNTMLINDLVSRFPNLLLIDVAQVLAQVQQLIAQVARAVQFVFLFTLAAGLAVLYAAIASTQDERLYQAAILRTLGASRAQLTRANIAEFAAIGVLAGVNAAAGANLLGAVLAYRIVNVDYAFSPSVWMMGIVGSVVGIAIAGYLGTRRAAAVSPLLVLRQLT